MYIIAPAPTQNVSVGVFAALNLQRPKNYDAQLLASPVPRLTAPAP